jgi:hypothetical protein
VADEAYFRDALSFEEPQARQDIHGALGQVVRVPIPDAQAGDPFVPKTVHKGLIDVIGG